MKGEATVVVLSRWSSDFFHWMAEVVPRVVLGMPHLRANPQQLCANPETESDLVRLRDTLLAGAADHGHAAPFLGLQLTHSGRFARP